MLFPKIYMACKEEHEMIKLPDEMFKMYVHTNTYVQWYPNS